MDRKPTDAENHESLDDPSGMKAELALLRKQLAALERVETKLLDRVDTVQSLLEAEPDHAKA